MSLKKKAEEWSEDIGQNWKRYLAEVFFVAIAIGTITWEIASYKGGIQLERKELDIARLQQDKIALEHKLVELARLKAQATKSEVKPPNLPPARGVETNTPSKRFVTLVETKAISASATRVEDGSSRSTIGTSAPYDCVRAKAIYVQYRTAYYALDKREIARSLSPSVGSALKPDVIQIAALFPEDKLILEYAKGVTSGWSPDMARKLGGYLQVLLTERCESVAPFVTTPPKPSVVDQCSSEKRVRASLAALRTQTEDESPLTTKDHLVDSYNLLLAEAKNALPEDQLIGTLQKARIYEFFPSTKSNLLHEINLLVVRLEHIGKLCGQ